jgi:hypothetical protein
MSPRREVAYSPLLINRERYDNSHHFDERMTALSRFGQTLHDRCMNFGGYFRTHYEPMESLNASLTWAITDSQSPCEG